MGYVLRENAEWNGLSCNGSSTCRFSASLLLMALLTFVIVFFVSHSVLQKNLKDELIHTVEDNLDEVEFYRSVSQMHIDGDTDQYIHYGVGYLEIDDDFLDQVNGICTGLYRENGELLYGENPITEVEIPAFADGVCHTVRQGGEVCYLFDRQLEQSPIRELWLRGVVAESSGRRAPAADCADLPVVSGGEYALRRWRRNGHYPAGPAAHSRPVSGGGADQRRGRFEKAHSCRRKRRAFPVGRGL